MYNNTMYCPVTVSCSEQLRGEKEEREREQNHSHMRLFKIFHRNESLPFLGRLSSHDHNVHAQHLNLTWAKHVCPDFGR